MAAVGEEAQRSRIVPPARSATVVALVILDSTGAIVTVAAAVVLMANDGINRRWWLAVGAAFLLAVLTTVFLIRSWLRRQSFLAASKALAQELQGLERDAAGILPATPLLDLAHAARKAAHASGDLAEEIRLTTALERFS